MCIYILQAQLEEKCLSRCFDPFSLRDCISTVAKMKASGVLLPLLFGAVLGIDLSSDNSTQSDLRAQYEKLTESILSRALERIDENERCARAKGEEPTCTRDNLVFRKE
jgi:hypothetical protein